MHPSVKKAVIAVLTFTLLGVALFLQHRVATAQRYVIIHSDDAGMYPSVNLATIDAMERGLVSSCSILVPCPAFEDFAVYARAHPEKDFGVHLALNCETSTNRWGPVSPKQLVPSLLDSEGNLRRSVSETSRLAKLDEVERELRAQIEKALAAGIRVSHLDHHIFVLYNRADFLRLYVNLALEFNLPIRYTEVPDPEDFNVYDREKTAAFQDGLEKLRSRALPILHWIDSNNYSIPPNEKRTHFLTLLNQLEPGVTEILIHCGYETPGPMRPPSPDRRQVDTRIFMSPEMATELDRRGIRVINWRQFRELSSARSDR